MEVKVLNTDLAQIKDEAVALTFFEEEKVLKGKGKQLDGLLSGGITNLMKAGDFTGKAGQVTVFYPQNGYATRRIFLIGLGKKNKFDLDKIRTAGGRAIQKAKELKLKKFSFIYPDNVPGRFQSLDIAQALTEGVILANYEMAKYKTVDRDKIVEIEDVAIIEKDSKKSNGINKGKEIGEITSWSACLTRDWVNFPPNELTPTKLADETKKLALKYNVKCQVLTPDEIKKLGMGALLGVAKGSQEPCRFIILEYNGGRKTESPVVLVGKGITFDSGGISIKPAENMDQMKGDMAGAATVISAGLGAARLKLPVNLVVLVPTTENLPSGTAYKPGDILTSMSGKTIEVLNTDAEGRVVLADALHYATRYKPKAVIDLATLTGACVIALGNVACGMMGTDDKLKNRLKDASKKTAEKVWELPLFEEYEEQIKSSIADVKNTGGRPAGTITAALFLKMFTNNYPWVHLDIAGMDLEEKGKAYVPKGASGYGVRLLIQMLRDWRR